MDVRNPEFCPKHDAPFFLCNVDDLRLSQPLGHLFQLLAHAGKAICVGHEDGRRQKLALKVDRVQSRVQVCSQRQGQGRTQEFLYESSRQC